jgi:Tfp pilus assembly protein PilO
VQYVLAGIRRSPLKLESFTPQESLALGPFKIVVVQIKLTGTFADLDGFLHWLESNPRLFRVDKLKFTPDSQNTSDDMSMDISLLGLMG